MSRAELLPEAFIKKGCQFRTMDIPVITFNSLIFIMNFWSSERNLFFEASESSFNQKNTTCMNGPWGTIVWPPEK